MTKNAISSIVIIVLMIGAIVYGNHMDHANTELDTIKNGFKMLICGIIIRLEKKD